MAGGERYQETGDIHDQVGYTAQDNCSKRQLAGTTVKSQTHANRLTAPEVDASISSRTVHQILPRNGLYGRISAQKPVLNKRQLRNRAAYTKAQILMEGWTAEKWQKIYFSGELSVELHPMCRQYCRQPLGGRLDPRFTQKTVKFGGGKRGVTSNTEVPGRSLRWMVTLIMPNINRFLNLVRFFNRMELLAIPQVPL